MNELVVMKDQRAVTSSLKVAEIFNKNHQHILETIDKLTVENPTVKDLFYQSSYINSRGREYRQVFMDKDGFTLLGMSFTGKKALQFKLDYIKAFNSMEEQIKTGYTIPGSYAEALKLAAQQSEQIELQKPKVLFADSVSASHSTILIGELAKILRGNGVDIGATRLFKWMRDNGYLISRQGSDWNMPTQRAMNLGLFKIKETSISHSDGSVSVSKTTKVTGKGQQYFINKFLSAKE